MSDPAPFFAEIAEAPEGGLIYWCKAGDGTRIRAGLWHGAGRGTILLCPGRTEYIEKYGPVVTRLTEMGFGVLVIDWRGQGLSDRPDNSTALGHVEHFDDYQQDLSAALEAPEAAGLSGPYVLIGHSMGGCIGLRAFLDRPEIAAAIFSAPMWGIKLSAPMRLAAKAVILGATAFGQLRRHAPGTSAEVYAETCDFEDNTLTSDPERLAGIKAQLKAHPELGLGGPSLRWLREGERENKRLAARALPERPVLTLLGDEEDIVDPASIHALMPRFANGSLKVYQTARHEIFMETDAIQQQVWADVSAFLTRMSRPQADASSASAWACSSGVAAARIWPPSEAELPSQHVTMPPAASITPLGPRMS